MVDVPEIEMSSKESRMTLQLEPEELRGTRDPQSEEEENQKQLKEKMVRDNGVC